MPACIHWRRIVTFITFSLPVNRLPPVAVFKAVLAELSCLESTVKNPGKDHPIQIIQNCSTCHVQHDQELIECPCAYDKLPLVPRPAAPARTKSFLMQLTVRERMHAVPTHGVGTPVELESAD